MAEYDIDDFRLLEQKYGDLKKTEFETIKKALSNSYAGEIEPNYIMHYRFYEGILSGARIRLQYHPYSDLILMLRQRIDSAEGYIR